MTAETVQSGRAERWSARVLIVNADDFGASSGVNTGISRAHDVGIVSSASLMVTMPAATEAVSLARERPGLSLGIHIDLTGEGTPAPVHLDDVDACRAEMWAQMRTFERLVGHGPTHIDSHHNVHRLALLEPLFVELAREHRLPLREHSVVRYFPDFYGVWDDGETHAEWISAANLIRMLDEDIGPGVTELSCHPGLVDPALRSPYHREREIELAALCDPAVRRHLERSNIVRANYADLERVAPYRGR
jgi:predicted glycoside hydrolase/deacetylase ChbG (UPF0249 family)